VQDAGGVAGELDELRRAHAVAREERRLDAELGHLLGHRAGRGVHAAVHHDVRLGAADLGQDRVEVGGLVVREFARDDLQALFLRDLLDHVRQALAVGGAVVDDRDGLGLQRLGGVIGEHRALLVVVGDDAEGGLESLLRVLRIGRRGRDLRDARVGVDLRGRNRRAGVQVADDGNGAGVDDLLRGQRAFLRVGLVVLGDELELEGLVADLQAAGGVDLLDRETAPFSLSLPRWAMPPVSGPTWPILMTSGQALQVPLSPARPWAPGLLPSCRKRRARPRRQSPAARL
jgi:hypothetical protein